MMTLRRLSLLKPKTSRTFAVTETGVSIPFSVTFSASLHARLISARPSNRSPEIVTS